MNEIVREGGKWEVLDETAKTMTGNPFIASSPGEKDPSWRSVDPVPNEALRIPGYQLQSDSTRFHHNYPLLLASSSNRHPPVLGNHYCDSLSSHNLTLLLVDLSRRGNLIQR
ncbi:hypothetical protein RUM43_003259 [Polyplax serrata]|uniref:Uncharacterized protein n=1 Tax=Polyplax serrata TaxID=468196 RepID=A0AAN8PP20_POLSC